MEEQYGKKEKFDRVRNSWYLYLRRLIFFLRVSYISKPSLTFQEAYIYHAGYSIIKILEHIL